MPDYVRPYLERIEKFTYDKKKKIELILVGGLALSYYGIPRATLDIDAEIKCDGTAYIGLLEYLKKEGFASNISENISGWGIIGLAQGYRKRAKTVYKARYLTLKILEPLDFVFSKLLRGTEEDFRDITAVIKKFQISRTQIEKRVKLISFPKDPETILFRKKFTHLLELLMEPVSNAGLE